MLRSTRSDIYVSQAEAVLKGIAPDGGLFVDEEIGRDFDVESCEGLSYEEMAKKIMCHLLPEMSGIIDSSVSAYSKKFTDKRITPVTDAGGRHVLELYHGPTCAFKDLALTELPYFVSYSKSALGIKENVSVLTATSGDTGKAALEGFADVDGTDITVFFPHGGVSDMQRLQMVTQEGKNVRVYAVRGNFDDCQRNVKKAFSENDGHKFLSSANSINIGRLVPQVVYYFYAYFNSGKKPGCDVFVPTGNFGDVLAGYIAKKMGLPLGKLVVATNENNVLYDFIRTGTYDSRREFIKTTSPSMDILVSSNLERLLFYASSGDTKLVSKCMNELSQNGIYSVPDSVLNEIRKDFDTVCVSEVECAEAIKRAFCEYGYLMDTHTACAYAKSTEGSIVLSTASPYKFPDAVLKAITGNGGTVEQLQEISSNPVPGNLKDLDKKEILHSEVIDIEDIVKKCLE